MFNLQLLIKESEMPNTLVYQLRETLILSDGTIYDKDTIVSQQTMSIIFNDGFFEVNVKLIVIQ